MQRAACPLQLTLNLCLQILNLRPTGHRIRTAGLVTLDIELENDLTVTQQFAVCEDGLFNRFNGLLGYDFMENYDVILRPKESLMYIGEHEIPLMSEYDSCQEYCIIGSRIERNSGLSGSVMEDRIRRRGKVHNDPSPAASLAESSDGGTEGSRMLPLPVAQSVESEVMVNRDFDCFEDKGFFGNIRGVRRYTSVV